MTLPKTKDEIIFTGEFLDKIKRGKKICTLRNSPVSLGIKKLGDDLSIEVYKCEKVQVRTEPIEDFRILKYDESWRDENIFIADFGFNSIKEASIFYNGYIKNDFAYMIHFEKIKDGYYD